MSETDNSVATIVVADDVEVCRSFVSATLQSAGYNVIETCDGQEAYNAVIAEQGVKLLVLDVQMPNLDGLQCLQKLRENPKYANLPVVLLTAKADRAFIMQAKDLKANQYLLKSEFRAQDLLIRVSRCLSAAAALKRCA